MHAQCLLSYHLILVSDLDLILLALTLLRAAPSTKEVPKIKFFSKISKNYLLKNECVTYLLHMIFRTQTFIQDALISTDSEQLSTLKEYTSKYTKIKPYMHQISGFDQSFTCV